MQRLDEYLGGLLAKVIDPTPPASNRSTSVRLKPPSDLVTSHGSSTSDWSHESSNKSSSVGEHSYFQETSTSQEAARMSIQIYIGHSGQRLSCDPSTTSLDGLKTWIAQQASIQPRNQILLTAQGKQVRTQTLLTENELFVFDSRLIAPKDGVSPDRVESSRPTASATFNPGRAPDELSNQNDLQAWQNLFRLRKSWASALLSGCSRLAQQAQQYLDEEAVIGRSVGAAVASLQQHIKSGEKKYGQAEAWADQVLQEQGAQTEGWEQHLEDLQSIPARTEFARFIQPVASSTSSRRQSQQGNVATLQAFVDVARIRKAASSAKSVTDGLADQLVSIRHNLNSAGQDADDLHQAVDRMGGHSVMEASSEPVQLLEEIQIVVKKISTDLEHVQSLPRTSQSTSQASKLALLHTRNYLPNLHDYCLEMNELVSRCQERRESASQTAMEHMRSVSTVEHQLAEVYRDVDGFGLPEDDQQAFATISLISRLPSVYGQLLVESVRRREWVAKMKRDTMTLQEEVATYQEEEEKRRRKWMRSVEDVVNADAIQNTKALGIELSLQNEGGSWPMVTRQELDAYLSLLMEIYGSCSATEEIDQAIKDLDKPTRKQIKHAKAFKNGSMHEAAFGDTSLMLRGDEQHKGLRDTNARLEEELKGQKSRVRKLEDLLHRQTQMHRGSTGDMFTPQSGVSLTERNVTPPVGLTPQPSGDLSRGPSLRHRRQSSAQAIEEKKLARRVVDLETELQAHKEEAASRKNSDAETQKQVEDAMSTKKDLMENMEAQQREFATERRGLEDELKEARERIEEMEGEYERLMGSRDDERTGIDVRIAAFEEEIARLKDDAAGHAARAATAQDAMTAVERKLELTQTAKAEAEAEIQRMQSEQLEWQEIETELTDRFAAAHAHLSPDADAPSGLAALSSTLEELARRSAAHAKDLSEAVAFAKSENDSLKSSSEAQKSEMAEIAQKQSEAEDQVRDVQERLDSEEARAQSLEQQLKDEKEQLRLLRTKFADGETGSEVLRQRVAEEESRAGKLSSELAEAKSHVNSLDVELMRLQKKHKAYHASAEASSARLEKRAERAKDISQRLYAQNARLTRLLERLGLAVSYQDSTMIVERASKLSASIITDPHSQMNRTTSLTSPPSTRRSSGTDETSNMTSLRWPDAHTAEDETAQFEAYLQQVSRFNIDTFGEAVVKRLRDFEYTAKKYNKEAKESMKRADAYKDRSVKLKNEAHAKIAVKDFKEGDLALFLPTRGQAKGAWAAFNIGCPHYFLAEREGMRLGSRDFIVARISKVEQKIVDLSKSSQQADGRSIDETSEGAPSIDDDNPFELSDGLTWWMVHATEERGAGAAPTTPGLGKSTVAAANVDARGSIRIKRSSKSDDASKHLNKSLDSRRSSSNSKKGVAGATVSTLANANGSPTIGSTYESAVSRPRSESQTSTRMPPAPAGSGLGIITDVSDAQPQHDQVRRDLLWGP